MCLCVRSVPLSCCTMQLRSFILGELHALCNLQRTEQNPRLNLFYVFGNEETECIFNPHWIIAVLCSTECLRVSLSKFIFHCSSYLILVTSTQKLKYHPGKLIFNPTQPGGTICTTSSTFTILRSAHTVYLCVLCGSENRQRLFHCTALTGWFL